MKDLNESHPCAGPHATRNGCKATWHLQVIRNWSYWCIMTSRSLDVGLSHVLVACHKDHTRYSWQGHTSWCRCVYWTSNWEDLLSPKCPFLNTITDLPPTDNVRTFYRPGMTLSQALWNVLRTGPQKRSSKEVLRSGPKVQNVMKTMISSLWQTTQD